MIYLLRREQMGMFERFNIFKNDLFNATFGWFLLCLWQDLNGLPGSSWCLSKTFEWFTWFWLCLWQQPVPETLNHLATTFPCHCRHFPKRGKTRKTHSSYQILPPPLDTIAQYHSAVIVRGVTGGVLRWGNIVTERRQPLRQLYAWLLVDFPVWNSAN